MRRGAAMSVIAAAATAAAGWKTEAYVCLCAAQPAARGECALRERICSIFGRGFPGLAPAREPGRARRLRSAGGKGWS